MEVCHSLIKFYSLKGQCHDMDTILVEIFWLIRSTSYVQDNLPLCQIVARSTPFLTR